MAILFPADIWKSTWNKLHIYFEANYNLFSLHLQLQQKDECLQFNRSLCVFRKMCGEDCAYVIGYLKYFLLEMINFDSFYPIFFFVRLWFLSEKMKKFHRSTFCETSKKGFNASSSFSVFFFSSSCSAFEFEWREFAWFHDLSTFLINDYCVALVKKLSIASGHCRRI